ncbi:MAG: hypothetical protein ACLR56_04550 [Oscillospiraceae bacterium]
MFGKAVRLAGLRISECKVFGYSQSHKKVFQWIKIGYTVCKLVTAVLISASSLPRLCATVSAEQATDP